MKFGLLFILSSLWFFPPSNTQNIHFKITNIRNTKGNFVLCFFDSHTNYINGQTCLRREIDKKNIQNGELNLSIPMPEGTFGVVLLDDENLNDKMDYGILLPKEGFGFSNHYPTIRKPTFQDFDFNISSNTNFSPILIKVKYM
ncbi:DUF2141 domain-containing protein [Aureispira anguillae]|uniref:DUF2141 domain-containing protein n=1 Tax=Aureispira anguillae TaxID=2864201 RepID=A0A915YIM4_9BACT|nr:DUF2141 domain-containing protein [Aureispira anguillae]BDS13778.1 DUF2141 domain-containing protein [Aureispira anguillae]